VNAEQPQKIRFSTRGRVTIPKRLRKEFGIEGRTRANLEIIPNGILIRPVTAVTKSLPVSQRDKINQPGVAKLPQVKTR
jgi:bifunctional DNA-binding transcriptional regulator/antitoxin component of YhaV-PrlF toxin-antitoxin module